MLKHLGAQDEYEETTDGMLYTTIPDNQKKKERDFSRIITALSNLAIQYNFQSIAVALLFMDSHPTESISNSSAAFPRTVAVGSTLGSVVFAGAIFGQLFMGIVGDQCGRRKGLILTNILTFFGALTSAFCSWGSASTIYLIITISRFFLGVGVGGKYPLAGTVSAESTKKSKSAIEIAFGFFWQTPGAMLPYAVGMALLAADGLQNETSIEKHQASFDFRLLLGLGALPALAVVILTYLQVNSI